MILQNEEQFATFKAAIVNYPDIQRLYQEGKCTAIKHNGVPREYPCEVTMSGSVVEEGGLFTLQHIFRYAEDQPHFNSLSPAKDERLSLLAEECAEVIKEIMKIQRHGYEGQHPMGGPNNLGRLEYSLGSVILALDFMIVAEDVDSEKIRAWRDEKYVTIGQYLHHNKVGES